MTSPVADRAAAALGALLPPLLWIAMLHGPVYWAAAASALLAQAILQTRLSRVKPNGSLPPAPSIFGRIAGATTGVYGRAARTFYAECRRDKWLAPALAMFAVLTVGFQVAGGAYSAEFDAHPDEPAHFVSSLLVYDYITQWPHQNPVRWAEQYYLHYPKVAIGHWPPGYYILEAAWWLLFWPSRASAMALNTAMCVGAAAILYRLLRDSARMNAPGWLAAAMACLMIASPVVQASFSQTMADLPCLLLAALFLAVLARSAETPSRRLALELVALLAAVLLVKGTGVFLVFAPALAAIMAGRWRNVVNRKLLLVTAAAATLAGLGYFFGPSVLRLSLASPGFLRFGRSPLPGAMGQIAGYGCVILAMGGVLAAFFSRRPPGLAATAILLSTAAVSLFLRDAAEPRHYIVVLPALLLLATQFAVTVSSRNRLGLSIFLLAFALFPFQLYRQRPKGFAAMLSQIHLPARMLVSSNSLGEGAWIAEVAQAEHRPASVIVRASQILALSDWDGGRYRLTVKTPQDVEERLDQLGLVTIVLDVDPNRDPRPHEALLRSMLLESPAWQHCARAGEVDAFCRVLPPALPRIPLQLDMGSSLGRTITEQ